MKKYLLKKTILTLTFIIISLALMAITFPVMKMPMLPKHILIDLCYIFALAAIEFTLPLVVQEIGQIFILTIELLILIASASLYISRGDIFNWSLLTQISQLKAVAEMVKISVGNLIVGILFIIGYIVLCFALKTETVNYKKFYNLVFIAIEVVCISVFTAGNATLHNKIRTGYTEEEYYSSDAYMYDSFVSNYASLQKFG